MHAFFIKIIKMHLNAKKKLKNLKKLAFYIGKEDSKFHKLEKTTKNFKN